MSKTLKMLLAYTIITLSVIIIMIFAVMLDFADVINKMESSTYDFRVRLRGIEDFHKDIVVIGIDDQSWSMLGAYPYPREWYSVINDNVLFMGEANVLLYDILFMDKIYKDDYPNNTTLAQSLVSYPNCIIARKQKKKAVDASLGSVRQDPIPYDMFRLPHQLAFVDMVHDEDKQVRRALLLANDLPDSLGWNYSFAVKAAAMYAGVDTVKYSGDGRAVLFGDTRIPVDEDRSMIINFPMDEITFEDKVKWYSFEQVFDVDTDYGIKLLLEKEVFKDKIVLVGATYAESKDYEPTPFYAGTRLFSKKEFPMYGIIVHASIINTILKQNWYVRTSQVYLIIALLSIITTAFIIRFKGLWGISWVIFVICAYNALALYLFFNNRIWMDMVSPSVTVIITYIGLVTYDFFTERKQKQMIKGAFSHYLPEKVVGQLLQNPDLLKLGGEERVMSVIFTDVAGFTTISEALTPHELVALLNEYLTAMTDIVIKYDGIIDKYEGDAIMAEYGAPIWYGEHALQACYTALEMQEVLKELRKKLKAEGRPELRARVGINTGTMIIGNMGSRDIFDYTVMGDAVNLGSRLEGANKQYGTYIMMSETTKDEVKDHIIYRELDSIRVKGKTEPVKVFEVLARKNDGISEDCRNSIDFFQHGLQFYKEQKWDEAITRFRQTLELVPDDPPSKIYIERCEVFKENSPGEDWDGVYTMTTK